MPKKKEFWKLVKVQKCDIEPGDRKSWYCRIIRNNSDGLAWDVLCEGDINSLAPLCDQLNNLTSRIIDIVRPTL